MKLGLGVTGGVELAARLRSLSTNVRKKELRQILRKAAIPMGARAAELAPIDPSTELDIKDSIVVSTATTIGYDQYGDAERADEFQAAVAVGPTRRVFYGLYLEYGTVRMGPHPFLRPAFDAGVERAFDILRVEFWRLLDEANTNAGPFKERAA